MRSLEAAETGMFRDLFSTLAPERAAELGVAAVDVAGGVCAVVHPVPSRMLNHVAGLGLAGAVTDADLDAIAQAYADTPHSVSIIPDAPADLVPRLVARGYAEGYAWMKFRRGVEPLEAPTDLTIRPCRPDEGAAAAAVIAAAFGLPDTIREMVAALPGRPSWTIFGAFDGGTLVGAGALFINDTTGECGLAGTLPEARGRGAQSAILAARIDAARAAGCTLMSVETGVRLPGRPDRSYRNILRAGFEEAYERPNYDSPDR
jgi:GNAT superfamily N-acetyltransferase